MSTSMLPHGGQHLTTGWEPHAPDEDTLDRQAVLVHASWSTTVATAAGRPARTAPRWAAGWIGDRGALTNPVVLLQPLTELGEVLAEIGTLLPSHAPYMLVCAWPTPDLRPHGLGLVGHPPLMARLPGRGAAAEPPPGGEVHEVRHADGRA